MGLKIKKVTRVDKRKNEVTFCMDLYDTGGENTGLASRMESLDQYEGKWWKSVKIPYLEYEILKLMNHL